MTPDIVWYVCSYSADSSRFLPVYHRIFITISVQHSFITICLHVVVAEYHCSKIPLFSDIFSVIDTTNVKRWDFLFWPTRYECLIIILPVLSIVIVADKWLGKSLKLKLFNGELFVQVLSRFQRPVKCDGFTVDDTCYLYR